MQTNAWVILSINKSLMDMVRTFNNTINKNWIEWFIGFCDAEQKKNNRKLLKEMKNILQNINILAIALPSLRILPLFLLLMVTIIILYAAALLVSVVYIQSIGSGIGSNSELVFWSGLIVTSQISEIKQKRLTKKEQLQFTLSSDIKETIVGLILGDLYIYKYRVNATLRFKQSIIHKDYIEHLYELFSSYCPSAPITTNPAPDKRTGKVYKSVCFNTYSLPCFNELQKIFYPLGTKIIPSNIGELLTPRGLCYWICDDGYWCNNGVHLCTNSFTLDEINLLVKVLTEKFTLKCSISANKVIRISSKSVPHLRTLLTPMMPSMMQYKIFGKSTICSVL